VTTSERTVERTMGIAALIVGGGVLLSRILGQIREIIFAWLLGASPVTDQYVAAFRIPDFLNYLLAGGFLSITFIPIFSRYLADDDEESGWEALRAILRPIAIGITGLVAIGWVAAPTVIELIYPDFTTDQVEATVRMARIVLPAQIFFVTGALFTAVQYSKGVFTIPTLAPIVYNLAIIAGGLIFAGVTGEADPEGFIWGAVVGAVLGNFLLQWWGARRVGMKLFAKTPWRHPALREYLLIAIPLMIGQSIVVLDETFMSTFGDLAGDGAQTQLQFARRTMLVPVGVVAQAAGVAAYPFLARLFAEGKEDRMRNTVDTSLRYVIALSILAAGVLIALSTPIIAALFQRGSFSDTDTMASAAALFFYAFSIPIWGALQILTRGFYAKRDMWTPVVIGTAATVLAIPIYWALQRSFGLRGVAVASTIVLALYTAALAYRWYGAEDSEGRLGRVLEGAGRSVPLAFFGGVAGWAAARGIEAVVPGGFISSAVQAAVGVVVFAGVALLTGSLLHDLVARRSASLNS
jgi:putative peptidoglycan lipid II flippase